MTTSSPLDVATDQEWQATPRIFSFLGMGFALSLVSLFPSMLVMVLLHDYFPGPESGLRGPLLALMTLGLTVPLMYWLHRPWKRVALNAEDFTVQRRGQSWTIQYDWVVGIDTESSIESRASGLSQGNEPVVITFKPKADLPSRSVAIALSGEDAQSFIKALKQRCSGAWAIDPGGVVLLPEDLNRRELVANRLRRRHLVSGIALVVIGILCSLKSVATFIAMFGAGLNWDAFIDGALAFLFASIFVGGGVRCLLQAKRLLTKRNEAVVDI